MENALAALHASVALQRLSQAASAPALLEEWHCLRPCLGQCAQEPGCLVGPQFPHLGCKDHQDVTFPFYPVGSGKSVFDSQL